MGYIFRVRLASFFAGASSASVLGLFVFRVRLASFFAGASSASVLGLFVLHKDYKIAHESLSLQVKGLNESLDKRISALEKMKETQTSQHSETTE